MKHFQRLSLIIFVLALAACQSSGSNTPAPTPVELPTVTMGAVVRGVVSTPLARPGEAVVNPATVQARLNEPTATPDTRSCPTINPDYQLDSPKPDTEGELVNAIANFLNAGGTAENLEETLRDRWEVLGETGFVRVNADLTGEGAPEVIISMTVEENAGALVILGCVNGRFAVRYQEAEADSEPPQIIQIEDINLDTIPDMLFVFAFCEDDETVDACEYRTQLVSWQASLGRFASILGANIVYSSWPTVVDMDSDGVGELVLALDNRGNLNTGPLRTGVSIYDWNGALYVVSIVRLDPVRYRIQVIHQADQHLLNNEPALALSLYERALEDLTLRPWRGDEGAVLQAYAFYRLLLTQALLGDQTLVEVIQRINELYPDDQTVYVLMARAFWDRFSATNDLSAACADVQAIIEERPVAVSLLNRYGNRSPTYTAEDLCPY